MVLEGVGGNQILDRSRQCAGSPKRLGFAFTRLGVPCAGSKKRVT